MAINWTNEYGNQPRQGSNPGNIAQSVRLLKSAILERMIKGHYWGPTEGTNGGKHKEGAGKVFIEDDESTQRVTDGDRIVSDGQTGRIRVDLNDRSPVPQSNGADITGDELLKNTIEVWDKDNYIIKMFDPRNFVSSWIDMDITGRKRYINENPEVQEDLTDDTYENMDTPTKTRAAQKAVKRLTIKAWTDEAKEYNIFDVTNPDNNIIPTAGAVVNPISGTVTTIAEDISAQRIFADKVYGAVYS